MLIWKPDTCKCEFEENHLKDGVEAKTIFACEFHKGLEDQEHYDTVLKENQTRNFTIGTLQETHPEFFDQYFVVGDQKILVDETNKDQLKVMFKFKDEELQKEFKEGYSVGFDENHKVVVGIPSDKKMELENEIAGVVVHTDKGDLSLSEVTVK